MCRVALRCSLQHPAAKRVVAWRGLLCSCQSVSVRLLGRFELAAKRWLCHSLLPCRVVFGPRLLHRGLAPFMAQESVSHMNAYVCSERLSRAHVAWSVCVCVCLGMCDACGDLCRRVYVFWSIQRLECASRNLLESLAERFLLPQLLI